MNAMAGIGQGIIAQAKSSIRQSAAWERLRQTSLMNYLRQHPRRFDRVMRQYMASHPVTVRPAVDDPLLQTLVSDGLVVLPGFFDKAIVDVVALKTHAIMEQIRDGCVDSGWSTVIYREDGIFRLRNVLQHIPEASPLLQNEKLNLLARTYMRNVLLRITDYVDYKPDLVHDDTTVPHTDTWRSQIKIFTLLNDVGPENAPLVYWRRSHRDAAWRRRMDYLMWSGDYIGSGGLYPPHVLRDLVEKGEIEKVEVTGPAGTVIVVDTRGPHRASNLRAGYRLQFVQVFDPAS